MLVNIEASAYGLKRFTTPRPVRHRQVAYVPTARFQPKSSHIVQLRYHEIKRTRGYQGWTEEEYGERVLELLTLVPSLLEPAGRFPASLLLGLLEDTSSVASRLIFLKQLFPSADVFRIVSKRPRLLLKEEFRGAEIAATKLNQLFPETDVGILVEKAPLLIVEDVDEIVAELRRLLGKTGVEKYVMACPGLISSVSCNRRLSIW